MIIQSQLSFGFILDWSCNCSVSIKIDRPVDRPTVLCRRGGFVDDLNNPRGQESERRDIFCASIAKGVWMEKRAIGFRRSARAFGGSRFRPRIRYLGSLPLQRTGSLRRIGILARFGSEVRRLSPSHQRARAESFQKRVRECACGTAHSRTLT